MSLNNKIRFLCSDLVCNLGRFELRKSIELSNFIASFKWVIFMTHTHNLPKFSLFWLKYVIFTIFWKFCYRWRPHLRGENCFRVIRDMSDCISFPDQRNESLLVILKNPFDHRTEMKTVIENMLSKICRTRRLVLPKSLDLKA